MGRRRLTVVEICRRHFGLEVCPEHIDFVDIRQRQKSAVRLVRACAEDGRVVEMVEKISRTKREARFSAFCQRMQPHPDFEVVPTIYATLIYRLAPSKLFTTAAVYMEALPDAGGEIPADRYGRILARIAALGRHDPPIPAAPGLTTGAVGRFLRAARRDGTAGDDGPTLEAMARLVPRLLRSPRLQSVPMVPCHNDMHQANVRCGEGSARGPVVIDWEAVGTNRAGSDLDRLFPSGDPRGEAAFRAAVEAYCGALRERQATDPAGVELAAGVYALHRRIGRYLKAGRGDRRRFEDVLATWRRLEPLAPD